MVRSPVALAFALIVTAAVAALACSGSARAQSDEVTIYRCTDTKGTLSLQDAPCTDDQSQQRRTMMRPKDSALPPVAPRADAVPPTPPPQVVVINAAQPLYECLRDDGSRYTSDNSNGNPRYIDSGGYDDGYDASSRGGLAGGAAAGTGPGVAGPRYGSGRNGNAGRGFTPVTPNLVGIPQGNTQRTLPARPARGGRGYPYGFVNGGGSVLVRDACSRLPQAEVCDRIRDRREDIRTRIFNAQANERARLTVEERGINARLSADCGGA